MFKTKYTVYIVGREPKVIYAKHLAELFQQVRALKTQSYTIVKG